jgi:MFS family permease
MSARNPLRYEIQVVLLLGLSYGFAFYDRQVMTFLSPFVIKEFGLNNLQVGALGSGLSLTWALGAYAFGRWSDHLGVRKPFLMAALVIFSLCSVLSGLAPEFWSLLGSRVLMGAVEGPFMPICLAIVAAAAPARRRGFDSGIVQNVFGSLLGGALAPFLSVRIAEAFGWRVSFFTAAIPGLLLALIVWKFVDEPAKPTPGTQASEPPLGIGAMLGHRNIVLCCIISCLLVGSALLVSIFLPVYLTAARHYSPTLMSNIMTILGFCPPVGGVLLPWLSDRYGRRWPLIVGAALMTVTPLAALYFGGSVPMLVALLFLGWIGMGTFPLFMAVVPSETLAFRSTAAAMGLVVGVGEIVGGVFGPLVAGHIADLFGQSAPMLIAAGMSVLAALVALALIETNPRKARIA